MSSVCFVKKSKLIILGVRSMSFHCSAADSGLVWCFQLANQAAEPTLLLKQGWEEDVANKLSCLVSMASSSHLSLTSSQWDTLLTL